MSDKVKSDKKYLTEIKELPNFEEDSKSSPKLTSSKEGRVEVVPENKPQKETPTDSQLPNNNPDKKNMKETVSKSELESKTDTSSVLDRSSKNVRKIAGIPFTSRDIILNVINILTFILLIVLLFQIDEKANQLKQIKNENIRLTENYNYDLEQVDDNAKRADELDSLLTDESGVIDFVSAVENLSESGAVRSVSFPNQDPISDRSGSYGQPVTINLRGSWTQIDLAIDNIHSLSYIFRPVKVEIERLDGNEGQNPQLEVKYGGLLYIQNPAKENETSQ